MTIVNQIPQARLQINLFQSPLVTFSLVNLHSRHLSRSDTKHELMSSFMKTLVLRSRTLRPYVPLRLHLSESALRINMFCITSSFIKPVQIDEYHYINELLTLHPQKKDAAYAASFKSSTMTIAILLYTSLLH
ncbi:hypothetical protein SAMN05421730_100565 [Anaerobium acetethylicum]|uniref:Uncharacterized protein n=1 Tax=Anaerobium acetethylicum TaxID=1619234 RepID=A0A1D3TRY8_9FIRM|nr:hypothetical protein SAMN05421730_100565 [Anaerobium acetethylicum]